MKNAIAGLLLFVTHFSYAQIANTISAADKVYGLSKFWQEVNYNFVYLDKVDRKAWDSAYKALIPQVQQTKNDYEYYRLLEKFCALLKDGHTNIFWPKIDGLKYQQNVFGDYLVVLKRLAGKVVVIRTFKKDGQKIPVGSEIIEVNGIATEKYLTDSVEPYFASSTEYVRKNMASHYLLAGLEGSSYHIKIKTPEGKVAPLYLTHKKATDSVYVPAFGAFYDEKKRQLLEFREYDNGIVYLGLNSFGNKKIDTLFDQILPKLYTAKKLIIDLRFNGGGSTGIGTYILRYLTNDSTLQNSRYVTRNHLPAFKAWGKYTEAKDTAGNPWQRKCWEVYNDQYYYHFPYEPTEINLTAKRIVIPTVILTGNATASAAEDFLIAADNQKHMIRMGERSFGSTGQPFIFDMPGGGSARVCTKKDTYPDGREFVGVGIIPHIEVKPTVADYIEGRDIVLDKALSYLK